MRNAMLTLKTTLKTATSGTLGSVLKPTLIALLLMNRRLLTAEMTAIAKVTKMHGLSTYAPNRRLAKFR